MFNVRFLFIFSLLVFPLSVQAELNKQQERALLKTQQLLRNPQKRMKAISSSKEATQAHQRAASLLGSEANVDKAYDMAAIMLKSIAEEAGGDPVKMQQILNKAKTDPSALADRMPAEFKSLLKNMAKEIENNSQPVNN